MTLPVRSSGARRRLSASPGSARPNGWATHSRSTRQRGYIYQLLVFAIRIAAVFRPLWPNHVLVAFPVVLDPLPCDEPGDQIKECLKVALPTARSVLFSFGGHIGPCGDRDAGQHGQRYCRARHAKLLICWP